MGNKYKDLPPLSFQGAEDTIRPVQSGMNGGFRGDVSPRLMRPDESPSLDDIRFERGAIRKDFGWQSIGAAAGSTVLGIIEHKFIDGQLTFHRLIRIIRTATLAALEVWDGVNWVATDTSVETINNVYLSMVSAQGAVYIAEGSQILCWVEELAKTNEEDDFPASNALRNALETAIATISPASGIALDYQVNYDVTVNSSPSQDTTIVVEFLHLAVVLGEKGFFVSQSETFPFNFSDQKFNFTRLIANLDTVTIRVKSAQGGGVATNTNAISTGGGAKDLEGLKSPTATPAIDDKYKFDIIFDSLTVGCTVTVGIYADFGAGLVQQTTVDIVSDAGTGQVLDFEVTIPGLINSGAKFALHRESIAGGGCSLPGDATFAAGLQQVKWDQTNADFTVHGHNKAVNLDDPAGVTYQTTGAAISSFTPIDPGPKAKYLAHFARRLIAFQDIGDSQSFAFSVDGILTDFDGAGSGQLFLVSSRSDPIDALQGGAVISSNFMAVFRARSIMRAFETGNVLQSIGVVDWIENLGTNSPFSIRNVRGGVMFLGHDNMMYFLTEAGPRECGLPIHQELITNLTSNQDLVDSGYDPVFAEYYLGIPVAGASTITRVWVFDVDRFLRDGSQIWRRKPLAVQRFATAGVSIVE